MNSASEELLEAIRYLDSAQLETVGPTLHTENIASRFNNVDRDLEAAWQQQTDFIKKVENSLQKKLSVVRKELEVYGTTHLEIEGNLAKVVEEVYRTGQSILKRLKIN